MRGPIKTSLRQKFENNLNRLRKKGFFILYASLGLILDAIELVLESFFRFLFFAVPLGLYVALLELRNKPPVAGAIAMHLTHESTFQMAAPGVLLVSIDGGKKFKADISNIQTKWSKLTPKITSALRVLAYFSAVVVASLVVFYIIQHKGF